MKKRFLGRFLAALCVSLSSILITPAVRAGAVLVNVASPTEDLIKALETSDLKYQRRYAAELLGNRADKEALSPLLKALEDPEEVVQKAAAESLTKLGRQVGTEEIFPELLDNLSHDKPCVRKYSAYVLGQLADESNTQVVEALQKATDDQNNNVRSEVYYALYQIGSHFSKHVFVVGLYDEDPSIRRYSAFALGQLKGAEAGQALSLALQRETDENVRRTIASALGKVGTASSVEVLVELLPRESTSVRIDIAAALGEAKTPQAIQALSGLLLDDPNSLVRESAAIALRDAKAASAARALGKALKDRAPIVRRPASEALVAVADEVNDEAVMDDLVKAVGDTDQTVADNAARALMKMNNLDAVHGLIKLVDSPNRAQVERVVRVLEEITHRPYGLNVAKWKEWYKEYFQTGG